MSSLMLLHDLFLLIIFISMCKSNEIRFVEAIKNAEFESKRIIELPTTTRIVGSKLECVVECKKSPSCLSFTFNDESKECCMYDQDFVHITESLTTVETGWNYYYVVTGNVLDKSACELPTTGICQSFCFFYRNGFWYDSVQDFIQACSVKGGAVIKVDRYLKQYCMAQAVDSVIGNDRMAIDGQQSESTGEWTYYDGTKMTYFYWDNRFYLPEPDYISPEETPGKYQGSLATWKTCDFMWFDYSDYGIQGVLCEIK